MTKTEIYIKDNYQSITMSAMGRTLRIPYTTVRDIMVQNGWQSTRAKTVYVPVINPKFFCWEAFKRSDFILNKEWY